jgi:thiol:disulfide interchange protein DsbA
VKYLKNLLAIFILLSATQAFAEPVMGRDYKLIEPAQPTHSANKIEVLEFFFMAAPTASICIPI